MWLPHLLPRPEVNYHCASLVQHWVLHAALWSSGQRQHVLSWSSGLRGEMQHMHRSSPGTAVMVWQLAWNHHSVSVLPQHLILVLACGPGTPELSKSYMHMASKLFTFTYDPHGRVRSLSVLTRPESFTLLFWALFSKHLPGWPSLSQSIPKIDHVRGGQLAQSRWTGTQGACVGNSEPRGAQFMCCSMDRLGPRFVEPVTHRTSHTP